MNKEAKKPLLALIWEGDSTLPALAAAITKGASDAGTIDIVCCDLASDGMETAQALLARCDGVLFGLTGKATSLRRLIAGWNEKPGKSAAVFYATRASGKRIGSALF